MCSEIIKKIHREELEGMEDKIEEAKNEFKRIEDLLATAPGDFSKNYRGLAAQELGEAIIFHEIITNGEFPSPKECGIKFIDYAYALADVIGELRRRILKNIREEELEIAQDLFDIMNEAYSQLFTLDYPGGLIPGLRRKIDVARSILAKTEGDLTMSSNIVKLNNSLKKLDNNKKRWTN